MPQSVAELFAQNSDAQAPADNAPAADAAPQAEAKAAPAAAPKGVLDTTPSDSTAGSAQPDATPADAGTAEAKDNAPAQPLDWAALRDKYANKDEKIAKRLSRYSSVESALDALIAAQNKIASGVIKSSLPEKATPEQLAEWREQNGIPTSPDGYELEIPEGLDLTDEGKKFVDDFISAAHEANTPPQAAQKIFSKLVEQQQAAEEAREIREDANRQAAEEALRAEWGTEYRLNSNLVNSLLDTAPQGVKEELLGGRLADGTPVAHSPAVMRWLATMAREINPVSTVVPATGENPEVTIQTELASLERMMGDHESDYWKGPRKDALQSRYVQLVEAKQKYAKRK